jgi:hypothetical protein
MVTDISSLPPVSLVIALVNETRWLLAYPVFVSLVFFTVFASILSIRPLSWNAWQDSKT